MNRTKDLLERLELPSGTYAAYLEQANRFLDYTLQFEPFFLPFRKPRLLKSKLFGQRYLVANFHPDNLHQGPFDATAFTSIEAAGRKSPPMVLTAKRTGSARTYNWILEHEFVHIHQMLQGRMPEVLDEPGNPAAFLARRAELEFEAHYLQLIHQGDFAPDEALGMNLEQWCSFRGYTSSLEDAMACILSAQYSREVSEDFLQRGPEHLRRELGGTLLGALEDFVDNYVSNFPGYISTALGSLCERARYQLSDDRVELVERWVSENLPGGSPKAKPTKRVTAKTSNGKQRPKNASRKPYFVDYEVTYRGRVGPFYVKEKHGHFDLADNDELVDDAIDKNAPNAEYIGSMLSYHCAKCGEQVDFEGAEDEDNDDMFALFTCGCQ